MNSQDAEEYTQSLGQIGAGFWRQIAWAKRQGVPEALGFSTEEWVQERLGGYIRLSIPDRREAVAELQAHGHSNREIAEVVGVDPETINRDVRAANAADEIEKDTKGNGFNDFHAANAAPDANEEIEEKRAIAPTPDFLSPADADRAVTMIADAIRTCGFMEPPPGMATCIVEAIKRAAPADIAVIKEASELLNKMMDRLK